ncbi:MAG: hypothetical protein Q4G44_07665 [Alcaligenaceae bacterium]|nr:hypothetical protein [Alcaligenaceae bacterium]
MQDVTNQLQESNQVTGRQKNYLLVTYLVFVAGLFTGGLITVAGLVMAYLKRDDYKHSLYESHVTYLIRTFWIGLLYSFISLILSIIGIGLILGILTAVWYVIRLVKGFVAFYDTKPIEKPDTWFI